MTKLAGVVVVAGLALLGAIGVRAASEATPFVGFQVGGGLDTRDGSSTVDSSGNLGLLESLQSRDRALGRSDGPAASDGRA